MIYFCALLIMICGLFIMLTSDHLIRKIIGLGVLQNAVIIFYLAIGKVSNGVPPILASSNANEVVSVYSSPLPQVLMLTAIVVGFATTAVGLALVRQIHREYGTVLESKLRAEY